jgi:hypothetical protein
MVVNTSLLIWISPLSFCKRIALTFLSLLTGGLAPPDGHTVRWLFV